MITLTGDPLDPQATLAAVQSQHAGAAVLFVGTTREFTDGRQTTELQYECYEAMARAKLEELAEQAKRRWKLTKLAIAHRLGVVLPGEASVLVAVSSPHRKPAFEAAEWIMETLKAEVPIWKQEHWCDGSSQWVHPGLNSIDTPR